ncbi:lytic transglycosylase domain-containing protein [Lysobacter enzymogenes]|uniref:lytic transglycosylase domain-containing protein n=1 Tax=Lysobacter enzymogenes TaxID=69 RepID=UPI00099BB66C|nr:lytic transglycosylase domain-containing protein [Lysobacter enzymogenes]UZW61270.1 lytic transglycosylase domain-containing protein [Lysobacter enzymogenes]
MNPHRLSPRRRALAPSLALAALLASAPAAADCIDDAARYQGVHPHVLRAIAYHESRMKPETVNHNKNSTRDIGLMGINTVHGGELSRYGIGPDRLFDPCVNAYVGAWLLRRKVDKYGATWKAVAAYHSETPQIGEAYMRRIQDVMRRWGLLPAVATAAPKPVPAAAQSSANATSEAMAAAAAVAPVATQAATQNGGGELDALATIR